MSTGQAIVQKQKNEDNLMTKKNSKKLSKEMSTEGILSKKLLNNKKNKNEDNLITKKNSKVNNKNNINNSIMSEIENSLKSIDNHIGGKGKIVPAFVEPINTPYHTSAHKEIYNKNNPIPHFPPPISTGSVPTNVEIRSVPESKGPDKLLVDLQVYQDAKKPPPARPNELPIQPVALSSPFFPPQFQNYLNNFMKNFYTPFVFKDYHINIGGPNTNHVHAAMVYEDALPPASVFSSYKTLKERNGLCQYIRGTFINIEEGEDANFNGDANSINSRLKLIELNPYNTNYFSSNPYKGLPSNILIYRSCYPIVYDKKEATTQCNKSSVGINMRVYRLSKLEYQVWKPTFEEPVKSHEIKSILNTIDARKKTNIEIIEDISRRASWIKRITPITDKTKNDFDVWREIEYYQYIRNVINKSLVSPNFVESYCWFINDDAKLNFSKNTMKKKGDQIDPETDSNKSIILLTESPNMNIFSWASDSYIKERNIQKQVYSGYKPDNVWESVIMQMLIVFYTMDVHKFTFNEMQLQNNFYIKDINVFGDSAQFWKYKIKDIDFFVPNYGHLLMFDSDYHDMENNNTPKIIGKFLNNSDESHIHQTIVNNALKCLSSNNYGQEFKNIGGVKGSENIINLLDRICTDIRANLSFGEVIQRNFLKYLHNRVGTSLRDSELSYVQKSDIRPFRKGQLVVWEKNFDSYEIVIYLNNISEYECECASREKDTFITKTVNKDLIYHYSDYETIKQDSKPGEPYLSMDYVIESYVV
jgi:hypothetical protein